MNDWMRVVKDVWKTPAHIARGVNGNNILIDFYRQLIAKEGGRAKYLFSCGAEDFILATFQHFIDAGKMEFSSDEGDYMKSV